MACQKHLKYIMRDHNQQKFYSSSTLNDDPSKEFIIRSKGKEMSGGFQLQSPSKPLASIFAEFENEHILCNEVMGIAQGAFGMRQSLAKTVPLCFPHQYQEILTYISIIKFDKGVLIMKEDQPSPFGQQVQSQPLQQNASENQEALSEAAKALASTYERQHAMEDIILPGNYVLNKLILEGSDITENMRARIRSFLMNEAAKQWVMRDTVALTLTYLDLYFLKGGKSTPQQLQSLAIGCLILGMKMQEGKFPTIRFEVFGKDELLTWERVIAKRLNYQLSPPTYATFAQHIVLKWDIYMRSYPGYYSLVQNVGQGPNVFLRSFYEQLDCIFMHLKSLSWPLESLVINLFYINLRRRHEQSYTATATLPNQEFISRYYDKHDELQHIFQKFLIWYSKQKKLTLIPEIGVACKVYLSLPPTTKEFKLKPSLDNLRIFDKLQTFPKETYNHFKTHRQPLNP